MKSISILKKLITIYYYLMLVALIGGVITIPLLLFTNRRFEINYLGDKMDLSTLPIYKSLIALIIVGILYYLYFRAIQLIKMSLNDLSKGNYFSQLVIKNFKAIGKLFLICGFGTSIANFVLNIMLDKTVKIGIDSSLLLFVIIGLFFMFLSEVFLKARKLQQENDLTV